MRFALVFPLSVAFLLQLPVLAQRVTMLTLVEPRVPEDPLEMVTDNAQPVANADQRAAAIQLLDRARTLFNVRGQAYDLKTTMTTPEGAWSLEDISPGRGLYRWTAQGPSYNVVNLYAGGMLYSTQPSGGLPLRLAQVRSAIFHAYPWVGTRASIRTATGSLNGAQVNCVLITHSPPAKSSAGPRLWEEAEYCADAQSGRLVTWSLAPGVYVAYDYSSPVQFHNASLPGRFAITQGGQVVADVRVASVTDPGNADAAQFNPSGLTSAGVGPLMSSPWMVRTMAARGVNSPTTAMQVVVVHGMLTPERKLTETEIVATSDASLNQAALDEAAKWQSWQLEDEGQPGATPQAHEVFMTVRFAAPAAQ